MSSIPPPRADAGSAEADLALLRGVLDAAPTRVCVVSRDRRYLYVNRDFADFAGRPAETILGLTTRELVGEAVAAQLDPHADRALAGEVVTIEGWIDYRRNGRRFIAWTFTPFAGPLGAALAEAGRGPEQPHGAFILFMRDLTESKQREEEAAANRDRLRAILEGVADGVNIVGADARLVLANAGFLRMYDFPPELGRPGTPLADFVRNRLHRADLRPDEDPAAAEEALVQARVAAIMARPPGRWEEARPDGRVIEGRTERLPDGTLVNTYSDLTLRREAERARRASRDALRRHERLSAIASLLGGVAHEINNPLAVVAAQSLLLAEEAEGTPMAARAEKVRLAAERCGRIVASLLASARQKPPKRDRVDMADAVEAGLDLVAEVAQAAGILVTTEIAPGLPPIRGDADQLAHLVGNLVGNARAALAGQARDAPPAIRVRLQEVAKGLELRVEDNGPGVPPALRERIFDPFFTTRQDGGGTGIGLALCRTIAKAHGGSIAVEAAPGGGAAFVVRLPVAGPGR
ncbi:sensor histidine kinase [Falsiroseomonas selenitidurans]|uniref:histidine kinase n=1 Tax=Falsiroseomonas selenitidurans TaxID=2716335 RepID=A0ABX1E3R2_9PROT|nr:PAS-domain containing protein [Falsiroseomonas selenitidurans]NKC31820.1 PAS domain-containing protein [Falsiroseomonas selenitidurans]